MADLETGDPPADGNTFSSASSLSEIPLHPLKDGVAVQPATGPRALLAKLLGRKDPGDDPTDQEDGDPDTPPPAGVFELFQFADTKDKILIAFGSANAILHGVLMPLFTIVFGDIINGFADLNQSDAVAQMILDEVSSRAKWFMILGVIAWITGVFQVACWMIAGQRQCKKIRIRYLRSILSQDMAFYDTQDSGELTARVASDVDLIQAGIGDKIGTFLMFSTTFLAGMVIGFIYGWKMTLVILSAVPALIISGAIYAKVTASATTGGQTAYAKAGGIADEAISLIRTVCAFGGEHSAAEKYKMELLHAYKFGVSRALMTGVGMGLTMFVIFCTYALGFWYGNRLVQSGEMRAGDVLTVFFSVVIGAMSIGQAAPALNSLATARGAAPRIYETIHRKSKIDSLSETGLRPTSVVGNLKFNQVNFTYAARQDRLVLDKLDLRIDSGKTLALVGPSGCGKSTSVAMIERFYDPLAGAVTLDGQDLSSLNIQWLRSQIGLVSQMPTLFALSIRENIALGANAFSNKEISEQQIVEAAKLANAHKFITQLPDGYDTVIGERGATLSGGQKQRVAIARALVRDPKILLFDEATSALDTASEKIVQEALEQASRGRTTIIIAHRLSTVRHADTIAVLDGGRVIEQGSHEMLMANPRGTYKAMVELQNIEQQAEQENAGDHEVERIDHIENAQEDGAALSMTKDHTTSHAGPAGEETENVEDTKMKPDKGILARALKLNKKEWPYIVLGLLGAVGVGASWPLLGLVLSELTGILVQENPESGEVIKWILTFVGIGFGSFVTHFFQFGFLGMAGEKLTLTARYLSFKALLRQEIGFFDDSENSVGALSTRLGTESTQMKGLTGDLLGTVVQVLSAIATGIIVAFAGCWRLALAVLAVIPVVAASAGAQMQVMTGFDGNSKEKFAKAGRIASEAVDNIRTVQSLGVERYFLGRYHEELLVPLKEGRKTAWVSGMAFGFSEFTMFSLWALAFWYGSSLVRSGDCEFLGLMKAVIGLLFGAFALGQVAAFAPDIGAARTSATKIFRLLDRQSEIDPADPSGTILSERMDGNVELSNVHFEYPTRPEVKVLRGLSIRVSAGQTLALVGESGCGKSTSVGLMERFYNVGSGSIRVDGHDISELNTASLRSKMSIVSQEPDLFNESVRENIAYGFSKEEGTVVSDDQIVAAAKMANAHEFISALPEGYETGVGERGGQLSGGQRQRVAIARALVRDPKILLLDEATSALDSKSERVVQEALDRAQQGRTTIVIAHRLSTIKNADIIAVVANGRIIEHGSHSQLMARGSAYATLVKNQMQESN